MSESSDSFCLVPQISAPKHVNERSLTWNDILKKFSSNDFGDAQLPYPLAGNDSFIAGHYLEGVSEPGRYQRNARREVIKGQDWMSCKALQPDGTCASVTPGRLFDPTIGISFWYNSDGHNSDIIETEHKLTHELARAWLDSLKEESGTQAETGRQFARVQLTSQDGILTASFESKDTIAELQPVYGTKLPLYGKLDFVATASKQAAGQNFRQTVSTTKGDFCVQAFNRPHNQ